MERFKVLNNNNGITIKELKEWLVDLPDQYENEEPTEVWYTIDGRHSNPLTMIRILNFRKDDKPPAGDILLSFFKDKR